MPMIANPYKGREFQENLGAAIWLECSYFGALMNEDGTVCEGVDCQENRESYLESLEEPELPSEEEIQAQEDYNAVQEAFDDYNYVGSPMHY